MEKNTDKKIKEDLFSVQPTTVLNAIQQLRQIGTPVYLETLLEVLCITDNNEVRASILALLDDLKDKRAVPAILKAIKNRKCLNDREAIVSSCLKSGLDFSSHLEVFFAIFIEEEFLTALEAYSVLENNIPDIPITGTDKYLNFLLENMKQIPDDRKPLADDIRKMLEDRRDGLI